MLKLPSQLVVLLLGSLLFSGCSLFGSPKGFDQQLAAAYGIHTAVVSATATALTTGVITSAEATSVQTQALTARTLLDTAKGLEGTNLSGAQGDLTLAITALTAIQTYLNSRSK
jgi:hypothetical protein